MSTCAVLAARFNARKSRTDNYETPAWAVAALFDHLDATQTLRALGWLRRDRPVRVLDPCAGRGALAAEVARKLYGAHVVGADIRLPHHMVGIDEPGDPVYHRLLDSVDYLKDGAGLHAEQRPELIIMNPPFTTALEFVQRALDSDARVVAVLQRTQFLEGKTRYEALFSQRPPTLVLQFVNRVAMYPEGKARISNPSGMMTFAWYVWLPPALFGDGTTLRWLPAEADFTHDRRMVGLADNRAVEMRELARYQAKAGDNAARVYRAAEARGAQPCPSCGATLWYAGPSTGADTVQCYGCKAVLPDDRPGVRVV